MVADGFGVGGADADIDQRDALAGARDQVVGRHLVVFPRQVGDRLIRCGGFRRDIDAAGARQGNIRTGRIGYFGAGPADKLIHIAGVVGEQHEGLKILHRGAGVVPQPRQRKVGAQGVKVRKREGAGGVKQAIGSLIANLRQLGGGEMLRQAGAHRPIQHQV
ncbi:hypothetical protein D3C72_1772550 [compost metagenome]